MDRFASEPPVEQRVGERLAAADQTLATAESFTGGLVAHLVTESPGASDYFDRGLVTYTYDAKVATLSVSREALQDNGAVTGVVAEQMARGAREVAGTDWGLSTTGVAGPDPGAQGTAVGTAHIGVAYGSDETPVVASEEYAFDGDRSTIKERGARQALRDLLCELEG